MVGDSIPKFSLGNRCIINVPCTLVQYQCQASLPLLFTVTRHCSDQHRQQLLMFSQTAFNQRLIVVPLLQTSVTYPCTHVDNQHSIYQSWQCVCRFGSYSQAHKQPAHRGLLWTWVSQSLVSQSMAAGQGGVTRHLHGALGYCIALKVFQKLTCFQVHLHAYQSEKN